ncbi:UNVERIFIED_CONTAM: Retrovirus-related Pol polyprotein from transposon TNT 1-94 [Sesamum radiatum]|uniref:Retrovirus-related Pol polyprotein from transposon TNT 1-94 n=1 Tax=Sesamum radiatum TaxID=300843 RepID=A0AAW2W3P8_SESRA
MTNMGVNPSSTSLTHEELDEPRRSKRARVVKDAMSSSKAKQWKEAVKLMTTIRILVALASVCSLPIHQIDMKTTFLYSELDEEIYMDQPEGFVAHGSCLDIITETKSFLENKFEMKDMGEADVILSIKLIHSTDGIVISQSHYVEKIVEKFGYQNSRIAKTPYYSSGTKIPEGYSVTGHTLWQIPVVLEGYSGASWIAKNSGSNGCSGYVFTLSGGAVSLKSAK